MSIKRIVSACIAMLLVVLLGSSAATGMAPRRSSDDMDDEVEQEDRDTMSDVLERLVPVIREVERNLQFGRQKINVLFFDAQNNVRSNRRFLKQNYRPVVGHPGDTLFQDPYSGEVHALPPFVVSSGPTRSRLFARSFLASTLTAAVPPTGGPPAAAFCKDDGTGAYRGVFSKRSVASANNSFVVLPGPTSQLGRLTLASPNLAKDTPFVFQGMLGFEPEGGTPVGDVDAGLFFNTDKQDWAFFWKRLGGPMNIYPPEQGGIMGERLAAGQEVFLQSGVLLRTHIWTAVLERGRSWKVMVGVVPEAWRFGVSEGMTVKRVTSIAQPQATSGRSNFESGSLFATSWRDSRLGAFRSTSWEGRTRVPTCLMDPAHVTADIQDADTEFVTIDLRRPTPPPPPPPPPGGCPPQGCITSQQIVGQRGVEM